MFDDGRSILALRGLVGQVSGAGVFGLPPDQRFYAGGSSTVRGYRYQTLGPQFPDRIPTGGTAISTGTVELRQRILGSYGVVGFVDVGQVSANGAPFTSNWHAGAGLGARYYTPIGPIRLDVAVPLNKLPGGDSFRSVCRHRAGILIRRVLKWVVWVGGGLLGSSPCAGILVIGILIGANTGPGRRLIESETASLTGGMVRIEGLAGRFPGALRADQVQVSDAKGPYVVVSGLILDWSPLRLLQRTAQIDRLRADRLDFSRLPQSESQSSGSGGSLALPVRVDLRRLHIDRAIVGAAVAGLRRRSDAGRCRGPAHAHGGQFQLDAERLDSPGRYAVNGRVTARDIRATVTAAEPAKGLISALPTCPIWGGSGSGVRRRADGRSGRAGGDQCRGAGASVSGSIDLAHRAADLAVKAPAPAMAPAAGCLAVHSGGREGAWSVHPARRGRHRSDQFAAGRGWPGRPMTAAS